MTRFYQNEKSFTYSASNGYEVVVEKKGGLQGPLELVARKDFDAILKNQEGVFFYTPSPKPKVLKVIWDQEDFQIYATYEPNNEGVRHHKLFLVKNGQLSISFNSALSQDRDQGVPNVVSVVKLCDDAYEIVQETRTVFGFC